MILLVRIKYVYFSEKKEMLNFEVEKSWSGLEQEVPLGVLAEYSPVGI